MSIATRITSIEEHIGDIYDTLELGGADLTNTDKNLVNVKPILKQKYLDYMNNGTREIWNNWEKVTGTGENVILNNTVQAPMDVTVKGNSEQVQYSGKNKLQNNSSSVTTNGVTITVNEDGSLQLTGTATGNVYYYLQGGTSSYPLQLQAGTYTLSGAKSSNIFIRLGNANSMQDDLGSGKTFTINEATNYYCLLRITTGTATNTTIYPMIEQGSTATSYEPYVGGTASPNPSYPQAITNVTGDVEVLVQNKNLIALNYTKENPLRVLGSYAVINLDTQTENVKKFIKSGDKVKLSCKVKTDSGTLTYNQLYLGNGTTTTYLPVKSVTISTEETTISNYGTIINDIIDGNLKIVMYSNNNITYSAYDFMLEKVESDVATTYTPHKEQTYTFPLGTQRMYLGDYLADDGIHHVRGTMFFDGTENYWDYATQYEGYYTGYTSKHFGRTSNFETNILCNYFENLNISDNNPSLRGTKYATYIKIPSNLASNSTELKTWLSTHNVTVEYELAEEEITPYTTEQQQAYDEIKQAISYEEQTNISGTSDELEPIFEVVALKNI